ncbi:hypothetical protein [Pseudomonas sp. 25 E 4]|nr:hypothetical protein [Pseudomonas sp. 25 E 4]
MKKKGGWGAKETKRDEVTRVTNVGTEIKTGGDLSLVSGGDQLYQRAKLNSGNDLTIASGGAVTFEAVKDLHQESHEKSKSDLAWTSAKGKGNTDETLRQSELQAQGALAIKAVNGLKIDIKQIDQNTVSQTIDVMVNRVKAAVKSTIRKGQIPRKESTYGLCPLDRHLFQVMRMATGAGKIQGSSR